MAGEGFRSALEQADDRIVAGRAMDGDVAAFAVLVRRYTPMMRAYTRRMLNASADVDDIVQETFVTAWQRFSELDDPAKVKSWLMRIVSRKAVDRIRALRPMIDVDDVEQAAPPQGAPARPAPRHRRRSSVAVRGCDPPPCGSRCASASS